MVVGVGNQSCLADDASLYSHIIRNGPYPQSYFRPRAPECPTPGSSACSTRCPTRGAAPSHGDPVDGTGRDVCRRTLVHCDRRMGHAAPATALEKLRVLRHISRIGMSGPPVAPYPSPESLTRGYRSSTTTDPRATAIRLVSLELRNTLVRVWDQVLAQLASSQKHVPKVVSQH